jgi:transposase
MADLAMEINEYLKIRQFKAIGSEQQGCEIHIDGELVEPGEVCPACGKDEVKLHQTYKKRVRHLSLFNNAVYLHFKHLLLRCLNCRKLFMQRLDFVDSHRQFTLAYEEYVYELLRNQSIQAVADLENLSWDEAGGILKKGGYHQRETASGKRDRAKPIPVPG